ncbi:MAG: hypothetical protein WC935_02180 [Thermoleophilia bacterium]
MPKPTPSRARTGTTTKHGFYSHLFTPEEIARPRAGTGTTTLDTISTDQFLADIKRKMLINAAEMLRRPDLSTRDRQRILKMIITITRRIKP